MLKKIILSSMLLLSSQVYADNLDKIFDIELGTKVDLTKDNLISNDKSDNTAYYKIDFKGFNKLAVNYTPTTNKIHSIFTTKDVESGCEAEVEIIVGILSKRYGEFLTVKRALDNLHGISSGKRQLIVGCNGFVDKSILLMLVDDDIQELAKKEQIEIEASKESGNF